MRDVSRLEILTRQITKIWWVRSSTLSTLLAVGKFRDEPWILLLAQCSHLGLITPYPTHTMDEKLVIGIIHDCPTSFPLHSATTNSAEMLSLGALP